MQHDPWLQQHLNIALEPDGITMTFPGTTLFKQGTDVLTFDARTLLLFIGDVVAQIDNQIDIHSYRDVTTEPKAGAFFKDNLELALGRAVAVSEAFRRFGLVNPMRTFSAIEKGQAQDGTEETQIKIVIREEKTL